MSFISAKEVMLPSELVGLFVGGITKKILNRFSQNSVKRLHVGKERNRKILVIIRSRYVSVRVSVGL